jgi:hypothetical protein
MNAFIDVGCSPYGEDCAQVGRDGYYEQARRECVAYIEQLRRTFGPEPHGTRLALMRNPHDFGTYLSVACYFDPDSPASVDYAYQCEGKMPHLWDDQARQQLAGERR